MRLTFENHWPVILLVTIPWLWFVSRTTGTDLSPRHLRLSTAIRSLIIFLLVLALMQPTLYRSASSVSALYLLDVSESTSAAAIQTAFQWIKDTNDAGHPASARYVAFAANSKAFDSLEALQQVSVSSHGGRGSIDRSSTNIAEALSNALRDFAPNQLKRLVLLSDGNDNAGDVASILPRLKQEHVHVYTQALLPRSERDSWIETVMTPQHVNADEQFPVDVQIFSQSAAAGDIELSEGDTVLGRRTVQLTPGLNRIGFETHIHKDTGNLILDVNAKIDGDPRPENNVFHQPLLVTGRPRVLYVEGHAPSAHYLQSGLVSEGLTVDIAEAQSIPASVERLDAYDAIILSDVDPKLLSAAQMQSIATYVRDLGGGFILAGGEHVYGAGGYTGTPIEAVLPVTFRSHGSRPSISMIVVLDRSSSMAEQQKIQLAKEATKAPVDLLQTTDHFGVLVFDFNYKWYVNPKTPVIDRDSILQSISMIGVGGDTNIYPALREAGIQIAKSDDEIKHIILLSDGQTRQDDFQSLATRIASAGITISTVAVGADADRRLLANIASWGGGKSYFVQNPLNVPQIFIEDTMTTASQTLHEEPFRPVVKKSVDIFKGIDFSKAPLLHGYVSAKPKATAEVLLESHADKPLLARWQYGLGKSAAFMSDVKDRWAADWLSWNGYSKFWSQLVRETMRRHDDDAFDFRVQRDGDSALISIDAIDKSGRFRNAANTEVRVVDPQQRVSVVQIPQVGPGSYEVRVPITQHGTYMFRPTGEGFGGSSRMLTYSYPGEYHFYPPDIVKLRTISEETGGTFQPKGPEIFDPAGESTTISSALGSWLIGMSLVLFGLDVLLRRLRWFERSDDLSI